MEDPADRIVGHYERHALSWDADRRAAGWIDKPSIERFLSFLPRGATVLDVGCGGGSPVALYMVAHGFHVTGVDSSRTSSRYAEAECRIRNGSSAICALWPLVGDFKGYWPGTASFISGTKTSERYLRYLRLRAAPSAILVFNAGFGHGEAVGSYQGGPLYHASL
jgi:SAM-dependent methyltransferase